MNSEIRIYSRTDYSGEPQLEALVSSVQLQQAISCGFVRQDRAAGIWRLTAAGDRQMNMAQAD